MNELFIESFIKGLGKSSATIIVLGAVVTVFYGMQRPSKKNAARDTQTSDQREQNVDVDVDVDVEIERKNSSLSFKHLFDHRFM